MKDVVRALKDWFVPHEGNDHRPTLLREEGVAAVLVASMFIFAFTFVGHLFIDSRALPASVESLVLVDLANEDRVEEGLSALAVNTKLVAAAQLKANDMVTNGYFAHTSPAGVTPWHWFGEAGYTFLYAGENLAVNFSESDNVNRAWMNSPLHRENILNTNFTEIGIATATGVYKGKTTTFVVQMFGSPLARAVTPPPVATTLPQPSGTADTEGEALGESAALPAAITPVYSTPELIVVENTDAPKGEEAISRTPSPQAPYVTPFERFLSEASTYAAEIYTMLIALVFACLFLMLLVEAEKREFKNIAYGVLVIVLLFVLTFAVQEHTVFASIPELLSSLT